MINKKNWRLSKEYLEHRRHVDQLTNGSMKVEECHLRYVLEWCGSTPFQKVRGIRPVLPEYLMLARHYRSKEPLTSNFLKKVLVTSRRFFTWLNENKPEFKALNLAWVKTLKVKRMSMVPGNKEFVTYDEILRIAAAPAEDTFERRIKAAACFLYLSGMRIGAFLTIPIKAVDIENRTVLQYPSIGVRTKNSKSAKTILLNIPELLKVVKEWDEEIRQLLPVHAFWFPPLSPDSGEIDKDRLSVGEFRDGNFRKNLRKWLAVVGLPYHSPHKFRHGHVHYGLDHAGSIADYKAVSMNVMHSSMEITDQFYSIQNDEEIKIRIDGLGNGKKISQDQVDMVKAFQEFLKVYRPEK